ncbi:MAG: ABC transporter ATP-binding protein [Ectothiorhodospiraceae bacterium]|nr:ABC transporter ATP-binding protein [Chromatiales bacterium]MCP5157387.1 ABC transporter ATP-binding protein [Ectothiorhodospiraceae bacterium]
MTDCLLEVSDVRASYGSTEIVRGVTFCVERRGIACLLGPSGCGKTTLLRAIAGLQPVSGGEIRLAGQVVSAPGVLVAPERRRVGMVFQESALFPHLTVEGNVAFGLRDRGAAERRRIVDELLDVVGLQGLGRRAIDELSGGQQQRVALARAIAPGPELVLLDEPFSSLDGDLRQRLGQEVRQILRERGITAVLVTHDQNEAFALAERIGVMNQGTIHQWDTPYRLYHEPANRFVADFIGQGVFLRGTLLDATRVQTELGVLEGARCDGIAPGVEVDVLLRPDDVLADPAGGIAATVQSRAFKGAQILYRLRLATGSSVLALFPSHLDHREGCAVRLRVAADHLVVFPAH